MGRQELRLAPLVIGIDTTIHAYDYDNDSRCADNDNGYRAGAGSSSYGRSGDLRSRRVVRFFSPYPSFIIKKMRLLTMPNNWMLFLGQIFGFYLLVVLAAYFLQDYMLYPAGKVSPEQAKNRYAREGLKPWPQDVPEHRGYLAEPDNPEVKGTVIVFHGNAGLSLDRTYYSEALNRLGYRVILAEYPGYGCREGKYGERFFVPDAVESVAAAKEQFGGPVFLFGESLGAAVAAAAVAEQPELVDGIAMITPWDSLPSLAQSKFWFLPARFIVKSKFDSISNLAGYNGPRAVLLAAEDQIIPPKHALRLYDALSEPRDLWKFEGAGHNSWPWYPDEGWWGEVMGFMEYYNQDDPGWV